nr:immunoglobulin light chain junction region [Macaca mulatta]
CLQGSGTLFTF